MRVLETPLGRGEEPGNSPGRNLLGQGSAALAQLDDPAQKLLPGARRVRKRKSASFHSVFARTGSAEGSASFSGNRNDSLAHADGGDGASAHLPWAGLVAVRHPHRQRVSDAAHAGRLLLLG